MKKISRKDVTDDELSLEEAKQLKWKAVKGENCSENCWCKSIKTEDGRTVLTEGWLPKSLARYLVKLHNANLER
jgi:hypothetical protein